MIILCYTFHFDLFAFQAKVWILLQMFHFASVFFFISKFSFQAKCKSFSEISIWKLNKVLTMLLENWNWIIECLHNWFWYMYMVWYESSCMLVNWLACLLKGNFIRKLHFVMIENYKSQGERTDHFDIWLYLNFKHSKA